MTNKTVLITGGASGIGRTSALEFARKGANVFIVDIDEKGSTAVAEEITQTGSVAATYSADVRDEKQVQNAIETCVSRFGNLDYAHNNAGIVISTTAALENAGKNIRIN
jgi:NAD(P)-dependent dehydrogenase (short-subunit alcohol dehydrogenase family)